jgi:uncharacterized Zn finger protein
MNCPACNTQEHTEVHFKSEAFQEDLDKCTACGTVWSVNHGTVEVVTDTQEKSFLSAGTECVECDDYNMAIAAH